MITINNRSKRLANQSSVNNVVLDIVISFNVLNSSFVLSSVGSWVDKVLMDIWKFVFTGREI